MKIQKVIPSGYCKGVVRAIELVKKTRIENPNDKIYVLGMIVHNTYVTEALKNLDVITLSDELKSKEEWIDEIDDGIVIFTAHGISDQIKNKAITKGLRYVDASCIDVIKTREIVKERLNDDYEILYIGKRNHPEAMAVLSISSHIHLISEAQDIYKLDEYPKVFVTNQTTMSIYDIRDLFNEIRNKYNHAVFEEEICNATSSRQKATMNLKDCDVLYIVGDTKSNNSNKLKEIAVKNGIKTVRLIGCANEIEEKDLDGVNNIYVTAGASTPTYLTNQVIDTLNCYAETHVLKKPSVDLNKII